MRENHLSVRLTRRERAELDLVARRMRRPASDVVRLLVAEAAQAMTDTTPPDPGVAVLAGRGNATIKT